MIPKIMVVEPTTAVPISTGLAVALKVLPAPSILFQEKLGVFEVRLKAELFSMIDEILGIDSMRLNS